MTLVKIDKVKKYYGDRLILDINNFEILETDRIGLVGENGTGKTTLIKAILGDIEVEEGQIFLTKSYSYISQSENYLGTCEDGKVRSVFNAPSEYEDFLSGGEKVKLKVSKALSENKSLIIADEPTSNLDSSSIKVLEDMLNSYSGALLLVSHDRKFLDQLCNTIVEIDNGQIKVYKGNYSKYLIFKDEERKRSETEYFQYVDEKRYLEKAILEKEGLRDTIRKAPRRMGNSEARLCKMGDQKAKKNLDGNIKALKSRIDHLEVKEKPKQIDETKIRIKEGLEIVSKNPIEVKGINLFVGKKLLLKDIKFKIKRERKVALIGDNGCGKSTLIKEIINNNNDNISIANKVVIGYFDQDQSLLESNKSILQNIKDDSSFNESFIRINLDGFGFKGDDVYKKISVLSGGEKVKVALCKIILSDNNLLILDEPTNYLDIKSMESLEKALVNTDKTMILVCHDREFVSKVCNYIVDIKGQSLTEFDGSYEEYIEQKNKPKISKVERKNKDELLLLENRLSELISILSIGSNVVNREDFEEEYCKLLKEINLLRKRN